MAGRTVRSFGDLLRQVRQAAGLTQEQLAERAGLSVRGISDLERGLIRAPRRDTLALLADALDLSEAERQRWSELRQRLSVQARASAVIADDLAPTDPQLPAPLTSFVGREYDQAAVVEILQRPGVRLLTITGPGGLGKTRLAIVAAWELLSYYPDGVTFIDLVPVRDHARVLSAIAATLGVRIAGTQTPLRAVTAQLGHAKQLLVLDNMEHVIDAATDILALLEVCPQITVLVTSRSPLHLQGEWEYPLAPLELPDVDVDLEVLPEIEAVALFSQRAQAVKPDFDITADNSSAVATICRRVDGLPLAIELAAARIRLFPPRAMLDRLERHLPLLESRDRDVPDRHRTLQATIQWSYDLLSLSEQKLYRLLSVFQGGWTLEAAESIARSEELDALGSLEQLVDQSFVRVDEQPDGQARYTMLETIREFGVDQLQMMDEADAIRRGHARYVLESFEHAESHFRGPDQGAWMTRLEMDHANLRAAIQWAREEAERGDRWAMQWMLRLVGVAWWFWYVHGHFREARDQLDDVVALFRKRQLADQSLADSPEVVLSYAKCLFGLASFAFWMAEYQRYDALMHECQALYRQFGQGRDMALALTFMGHGAQRLGNFPEAEALLEEGIEAFRGSDGVEGLAMGLLGMGEMRLRQQRYEDAVTYISETLELYKALGDTRGIAAAHAILGAVRIGQDHPVAARTLLLESLRSRQAIGDKGGIAWCLERLAQLALVDTAPPDTPPMRAVRLLGAAKALRDAIGAAVDPVDQPVIEHLIRDVQRQLSETAFIAAWEAGRAMALDDVLNYALGERLKVDDTAAAGPGLSRREIEVLRLLVEGYTNQQIADSLFISHYTVARHVSHITHKLGVESRTAAATWAIRHGIS